MVSDHKKQSNKDKDYKIIFYIITVKHTVKIFIEEIAIHEKNVHINIHSSILIWGRGNRVSIFDNYRIDAHM